MRWEVTISADGVPSVEAKRSTVSNSLERRYGAYRFLHVKFVHKDLNREASGGAGGASGAGGGRSGRHSREVIDSTHGEIMRAGISFQGHCFDLFAFKEETDHFMAEVGAG
jgi:hypothetical protein